MLSDRLYHTDVRDSMLYALNLSYHPKLIYRTRNRFRLHHVPLELVDSSVGTDGCNRLRNAVVPPRIHYTTPESSAKRCFEHTHSCTRCFAVMGKTYVLEQLLFEQRVKP